MALRRNAFETRRQLVQIAFEEFWAVGYEAASVNRILARAALTKGAFYHHFRSKLELAQVVLEEPLREWLYDHWLACFERNKDPITAFQTQLRLLSAKPEPALLRNGCPLNRLSQELAGVKFGVQKEVSKVFNYWQDGLQEQFMFVPLGAANFTVELRATGWHHSELTDPYKRSRLSDRSCSVLAEGKIAQKLYQYVDERYHEYYHNKQLEFDQEASDYVRQLPGMLKEETVNKWEREEDTPGEVHFRSSVNGMQIDVCRTFIDEREQYSLKISKRGLESQIQDLALIKAVYQSVEDLGQTSRLMTLTKALEQL